jgi:hypothetical protein
VGASHASFVIGAEGCIGKSRRMTANCVPLYDHALHPLPCEEVGCGRTNQPCTDDYYLCFVSHHDISSPGFR